MQTLRTVSFLPGIAICVSCYIFMVSANAEQVSPETQFQQLSRLYKTAQQDHGLWINTPELYKQAEQALLQHNTKLFQELYAQLQFMLSTGIEQAEHQKDTELMPAYLR